MSAEERKRLDDLEWAHRQREIAIGKQLPKSDELLRLIELAKAA